MTRFVPLQVTAHLAFGIAQAAPWGIALDGLLAAQLWEEEKAAARREGRNYARAMDAQDPPDLDLPLARCLLGGEAWHWAATCALPSAREARVDVRTWTGRVDARALEQVASGLPKVVSDRQGRYRARRMPLLVTACPSVTWRAVGDVDAVRALLAPITSVGKKRCTGEGQVLRWEVEAMEDLEEFPAGHLHQDGTFGRPAPTACRDRAVRLLEERPHSQGSGAVVDGGLGRAGLRPPYMHPCRQRELVLPALLSS